MTVLREKIDDAHPRVGIDKSRLRTDEPGKGLSKFDRLLGVDSHEPIEVDYADLSAFERECDHPFFLLPIKDCRVHATDDQDAEAPLAPAEPRKQASAHINVTSEEVSRSTGEQREKWLEASRKEISNLTSKKSSEHKVGKLEPNPPERDRLRSRATIDGYQYIELPAKVVWTIKPFKFNAELPPGRIVVLRKERDLTENPDVPKFGITKRVEPHKILAMLGIYVDDYLTDKIHHNRQTRVILSTSNGSN